MGHHLKDYTLTNSWVDLASLSDYTSVQNVAITIQAKYVSHVFIFAGGTSAPTGDSGSLLKSTMAITGTNTNWWVKGTGTLSIFVED